MNPRVLIPALLLIACPAFAGSSLQPWVSGNLSGATYSMSDVNADIGNINSILLGTGLHMDEVNNGIGFGLTTGVRFANGFSVGIGYDRLAANSKVGDPTGSIEYDMPANMIRVLGRYAFVPARRSGGFLEASLGRISAAGNLIVTATGYGSQSAGIEGSGIAFEIGAGGEAWISPQFGFIGSVGFRHAEAGDITMAGIAAHNSDGSAYSIDYSGLVVRAGIQISPAQ